VHHMNSGSMPGTRALTESGSSSNSYWSTMKPSKWGRIEIGLVRGGRIL
jgi:hypothetical protein